MLKNIIIIFLIKFLSFPVLGQEYDYILDDRDSSVYQTIKIGYTEWMAENLNYWMDGSYIYPEKCDSCGLLYTYESTKNACPAGFNVPTKDDWNGLFKELMPTKVEILEGDLVYYGILKKLLSPEFLHLKYCGFLRQNPFSEKFEREFSLCNTYGAYWYQPKNGNIPMGIHFETISDWIGPVVGDDETGFSLRCIRANRKN